MEIFAWFVFMQNGSRKKFFVKFERENENFFDYKDIDFKKPQNLHFSKGVSPWCLPKIWHYFLQPLLLLKMDRVKVIGEVLERKWSLLE